MKTYSEDDVRRLLPARELITRLAKAFLRYNPATVRMPPRLQMELAGAAVMLVMPCCDTSIPAAGMKLVTFSRELGVRATYWLLDPSDASVIATIAANHLTDVRTAATSAVATDLLARRDVTTLGIFGTGRIARVHALVLPLVRQFRRVLVCGSSAQKGEAFARELQAEHGMVVEVAAAESCARQADVICTCTTSSAPVLRGEWLRPGTHVNAVGAFQPTTREVDEQVVRRARVVVDTYEGALGEAGELLIPLKSGAISREHILAELHELVKDPRKGRTHDDQITLFKSVGCALEDLVAANLVVVRSSGS